jgi:hypothetical protein
MNMTLRTLELSTCLDKFIGTEMYRQAP